ncbi:MAG: alpha/beta fold hydrolase, partial [Pirellulales bacterium]|nr:alpha/beta fold hydrolase [Pirellulales bacterium]
FAPAGREPQRDYVAATRRVILSNDPRAIAAAARGMAQRQDFTPRLGEIRVPTLVLVGTEDAISTAEEMRSIASAVPGSRLMEIAGAGHMTPLEKPAEVTAALAEFLREISESGRATGS